MKHYWRIGITLIMLFALAGCGGIDEKANSNSEEETPKAEVEEPTTQKITYLDVEYEVPSKIENIVAASLEAMEDAAVLGIKPVGVVSMGESEIPEYLAKELEGAEVVGTKFEPSAEAILKLEPDVIIGTDKWNDEIRERYNKIQTMIPYTYVAAKWKENLTLMGQLTNKEAEVEKILKDYETDAAEVKKLSAEKLKDQKVIVIRVRFGAMQIYGPEIYLNPILYNDFGLKIPDEIAKAKSQEELSLETLSAMNPDVIFLQFEDSENKDNLDSLDKLLENPIFKSVNAAKNDKVFVNSIAPLAQGGTAWSKIEFLKAFKENLLQ